MKPNFVTADMFLQYTGINLSNKLRTGDNASDQVDIFLYRVEKRLMVWIDKHTFRVTGWGNLSNFQLENFRLAILEQAQYMWKNGDIALDSGYDQDKGIIADLHILEELTVCQPCIDFLTVAGLFNLKITNRKRFMSGDTFGIFGEQPSGKHRAVTEQTEPEGTGTTTIGGANYSYTRAWEE